jgi:serine/threonine protein kinase/Tol biopolymer transport system component
MSELTERSLGRYRLVSILGEGGMGKVYKGYDPTLERHVAIKILPAELLADTNRVNRFIQEARAASSLNHPHVVSVYDIGEAEDVRFIAMELVDGKTLREAAPLEIRKALKVVMQVAEALTAAHGAGIVHRDLKPDNIMLTAAGYAKVLDFGLAKLRIDVTEGSDVSRTVPMPTNPGVVMGTVGYMSPEQAQGLALDHRSDLFSLGCVLYELITGRRAFHGNSSIDTLHKIIHSEPEGVRTLKPDTPPELTRILRKLLAKDPDERYQTARDVALDIRELLRDIESNPSGDIAATVTPRRRSWWPAIAIVALLVAFAGAFAIFRTRPETSPNPPAPPMRINRVTANGNVISAAISPDGKFVTYVVSQQGEQSLWVRQTVSGQSLQLIPPKRTAYWGVAFAPDGTIYFGTKDAAYPAGAIHQIDALGGTPRTLITAIDCQPAFSPDGSQMVFLRAGHPKPDQSAMIIARSDGTNERVLASITAPEIFVPLFYTGPSWAPDGKSIAVSVVNRDKFAGRIVSVDVATGALTTLAQGDWSSVNQVAWMPDGRGLVAIAGHRGHTSGQVWFVRPREGTVTPITNDLFDYRAVSITADGKSLVTVASEGTSDIYVHRDGDEPKKITTGRMDGSYGVAITAGGRIAYTSLETGKLDIWSMNLDGDNRTLLTRDANENRYPRMSADGRTIVYISVTPKGTELCRMNADGTGRRVLSVATPNTAADVSPDGRFVIFEKLHATADGAGVVIARVPIDGGPAEVLTGIGSSRPRYSPDGSLIALYTRDPKTRTLELTVIDAVTRQEVKRLDFAPPFTASDIGWTADGRGLIANTAPSDRANLWLVPLDGSAPQKLTRFDERHIMAFVPLPDRKGWVIARGTLSRDAVLITGFEPR